MNAFSVEIGKHHSVFDVAAGYGRIAKFIDPSNSYQGIDLNEIFINHGRKQGLHLEVKNIFDPNGIFNPGKKVHADIEFAMSHIKEK